MSDNTFIKQTPTRVFFGEERGKLISDPKTYVARLFYGHPRSFIQARYEALMHSFMRDGDKESIQILKREYASYNAKMNRPRVVRFKVRAVLGKPIVQQNQNEG